MTQRYDYDETWLSHCWHEGNDIKVSLGMMRSVASRNSRPGKKGAALSTTLTYEDLNREIKHEISASGQSALVIEQTYQRNHLLKERIT
ncbi:hypothetical protein FIV31_06310 [Coxiella endosymbiont of Ornithodoros amblus]|uniref:hypothetical protein n=1 Tax=Coxiella endosymbiont of Ornithodoros amblus TaxID=1656166 RepID=UPI00244DB722|nr:hypothetical protein [Coxiella endosymbiont of Ornithodoros amblus]MBW5802942.1 hypothetical protein [Coxiella endosymbiont of Ornithodoros amblus]